MFVFDHDHPSVCLAQVALEFLHGLDLVHTDLKPENILFKSYSRCEVKVIDFGSSCFTHEELSYYVQSRSYRAPEVIIGVPYTTKVRTDLPLLLQQSFAVCSNKKHNSCVEFSDYVTFFSSTKCMMLTAYCLRLDDWTTCEQIDVWSLGCILAELYTGRVLFPNDSGSCGLR